MTYRHNVLNILNYRPYENMPVVNFGYWEETLEKWMHEGHITNEEYESYCKEYDNSPGDQRIMERLGFDFNWNACIGAEVGLFPKFDIKVLEEFEDGSRIIRDEYGLIVKDKPSVVGIPAEIGTTLVDRKAWEKYYLPGMQYSDDRMDMQMLSPYMDDAERKIPIGLHCGSLIGTMRNYLGVEQLSYLYMDDKGLFVEIANTFADISYKCTEVMLKAGIKFDYAHFWEDICYKNGPLVNPSVFKEVIAPNYKKITNLLSSYSIDIVSVDCDGCIDALLPIWLENGVNTMFPIEVGTWGGSIGNWRSTYGKTLRGVGGMNKTVFATDKAGVDKEIERLKPLIEIGGYIPCPDHCIPPDAIWENVQYYCDRLRRVTS